MQNIFDQSPLSIRNILSFLGSTDIINLETIHPKFRLLGDLELYQQAITDIFEHANIPDNFSNIFRSTNIIHTRSDFLKSHDLVENPMDNSLSSIRYSTLHPALIWKCQLNATTNPTYITPELITRSEAYYNPLRDKIHISIIHLKKRTILEFDNNWMLLENIRLSFDNPANLEKYLNNIENIELIIGEQTINCQNKFDLEMFWRNLSTNENYLPLLGQNISIEQPSFRYDYGYQQSKIVINYDQPPEIQPEIQLIGYMIPVQFTDLIDRLIIQNQYIGCNKITHKMQEHIKLYFNHPVLNIYLIIDSNNDCNDEIIEKISLTHNDSIWASFKPNTLCRVIPQHLAMPSLKNQKYYMISFTQINPFNETKIDCESYKQTLNFSRLDTLELVVKFKYPFTGKIQIMANSLNAARIGHGFFSLMYAN